MKKKSNSLPASKKFSAVISNIPVEDNLYQHKMIDYQIIQLKYLTNQDISQFIKFEAKTTRDILRPTMIFLQQQINLTINHIPMLKYHENKTYTSDEEVPMTIKQYILALETTNDQFFNKERVSLLCQNQELKMEIQRLRLSNYEYRAEIDKICYILNTQDNELMFLRQNLEEKEYYIQQLNQSIQNLKQANLIHERQLTRLSDILQKQRLINLNSSISCQSLIKIKREKLKFINLKELTINLHQFSPKIQQVRTTLSESAITDIVNNQQRFIGQCLDKMKEDSQIICSKDSLIMELEQTNIILRNLSINQIRKQIYDAELRKAQRGKSRNAKKYWKNNSRESPQTLGRVKRLKTLSSCKSDYLQSLNTLNTIENGNQA